jgi:preprotein translocase subunit SecG
MLLDLLLTLNCIVCLALIGVVLLQRSEGGALGGGGSPTGLVTTRGAGDLLTRATWVLFAMFLTLSLSLTLLGGRERSNQAIIDRLKLQSINPDAAAAARRAAAASPGQSAPPPVAAAPSGPSAPRPTVRLPAPDAAPAPGASAFTTPTPAVSLPPTPAAPAKSSRP